MGLKYVCAGYFPVNRIAYLGHHGASVHHLLLGKLVVGEHKIRFLNGDETYMEKHISIEH
jgi:hypothetical protein